MAGMAVNTNWSSMLPKGIGNDQQATQATAAMRQAPWYQQWMKSNNVNPQSGQDAFGNVTLSDQQQQGLLDTARQNGVGISDSYHVDQNGQIAKNDSHWLRNLGIAGAIAGSMFIPGVAPAIWSGLSSAGSAIGSGLSTVGHGIAGAMGLGGSQAAGGLAIPGAEFDPAMVYGAGAGGGAASGAGAGMGIGSKILGGLGSFVKGLGGGNPASSNAANLSSLLGAWSQGEKANRVVGAQIGSQYNKDMLSAQTNRDQVESDALRNLAITSYLTNGHGGYKPTSISLGGQDRQLPDFGFGYTAPSDSQKQGATALQSQLVDRLKPGGTFTPVKPNIDPGTLENIGSYGGVATGLMGGLYNMFMNNGSQQGAPSYSSFLNPNLAKQIQFGGSGNDSGGGFDWSSLFSGNNDNNEY